ncbi:MAG: hypothetical protein KGK11_07690 [Sphingomonadales bacterium]|nr:hypothetical protein [Sphingomonadales bacterium]
MDRQIVWPGAIPLETDLLNTNRYAMVGLGQLAMDVLGRGTLVSGLACTPTAVASMSVNIGAGAIYSLENIDNTAYSSLAADTADQVVKQGILAASAGLQLTMTAPVTAGTSVIYLIEAAYSEIDSAAVTLPFYNSANPAVPFSGPGNNGQPSFTRRAGTVNVQAKAGIAAATPVAPAADTGFVPLYYVTIAYGQSAISTANIAPAPGAPFLPAALAGLMPIAGGTFTGNVFGPTPASSDASTRLATTAMVHGALAAATVFATDGGGNWKLTHPNNFVEMGGVVPAALTAEGALSLTFPFGGFATACVDFSANAINPSGNATGDTTFQEVSLSRSGANLFVQDQATNFSDDGGGYRWRAKGY